MTLKGEMTRAISAVAELLVLECFVDWQRQLTRLHRGLPIISLL